MLTMIHVLLASKWRKIDFDAIICYKQNILLGFLIIHLDHIIYYFCLRT